MTIYLFSKQYVQAIKYTLTLVFTLCYNCFHQVKTTTVLTKYFPDCSKYDWTYLYDLLNYIQEFTKFLKTSCFDTINGGYINNKSLIFFMS